MATQQQGPTIEDRLSSLEAKTAEIETTLETHVTSLGQTLIDVKAATRPGTPTVSLSALVRRLERHGIRILPEDLDEAQGSGSERYGDATDWTQAGRTADGFPVVKGSPEDVT